MFEINGKTAIVTGAGSGIGYATASTLIERGANVLMVDREPAVAAACETLKGPDVPELKFLGPLQRRLPKRGACAYLVGDVTDDTFRASCFHHCHFTFGAAASILVPAAGITDDGLTVKIEKGTGRPIRRSLEKFREVLEINLTASYAWAGDLIEEVAKRRFDAKLGKWSSAEDPQGAVIFIGSVSGRGMRGQASYASSKSALVGLARTFNAEGQFFGVHCRVLNPGFTKTPMTGKMLPATLEKIVGMTDIGRLIDPEEIAEMVCVLIEQTALECEITMGGGLEPPLKF